VVLSERTNCAGRTKCTTRSKDWT